MTESNKFQPDSNIEMLYLSDVKGDPDLHAEHSTWEDRHKTSRFDPAIEETFRPLYSSTINAERVRHRKYIIHYMGIARHLAKQNDRCGSRQIGAVVVESDSKACCLNGNSTIVGTGVNGPPTGIPHSNTDDHYKGIVIPDPDVRGLSVFKECTEPHDYLKRLNVLKDAEPNINKKRCTRKLLGYNRPGEKEHLCTCQHAEQNAIHNCSTNIKKSPHSVIMFCWCGVPCRDCTIAICQNNINAVYCLDRPLYSKESIWMFNQRGIGIHVIDELELEREMNI